MLDQLEEEPHYLPFCSCTVNRSRMEYQWIFKMQDTVLYLCTRHIICLCFCPSQQGNKAARINTSAFRSNSEVLQTYSDNRYFILYVHRDSTSYGPCTLHHLHTKKSCCKHVQSNYTSIASTFGRCWTKKVGCSVFFKVKLRI